MELIFLFIVGLCIVESVYLHRKPGKYRSLIFLVVLSCVALISCGQNTAGPGETDTAPAETEAAAQKAAMASQAEELAKEAVDHYMEFMKHEDMYTLTATPPYPRGDSKAAYAIGDCTGDGVPELHFSGGGHYDIYTYREGEVEFLSDFYAPYEYAQLTPEKDGTLVESWRTDNGPDTLMAVYRIPPEGDLAAGKARLDGSEDYYEVIRLVPDGTGGVHISTLHSYSKVFRNNRGFAEYLYEADEEPCTKDEWEQAVGILNDQSNQLSWTPVFPKEEWDYLDAKEEGNGAVNEEDSEEWRFYKRILSGDFSLLDMENRSRLDSRYESSLDPTTGRCGWKYILLDFNGDGIKDLFIELDPDSNNYTSTDFYDDNVSREVALISYSPEKTECMLDEGMSGIRVIPLRNGQIIWMDGYGPTRILHFDRMKQGTVQPETEKEFTILDVSYDDINSFYNKDWYEEWYGPGRKDGERYYFVQDYKDDHMVGGREELSKEEWKKFDNWLAPQLIPDSEWNPASVFLPERYPASFSQG